MTGQINHITADYGLRLAWPEAGFVYRTDSDFFLIVGCARGSIPSASVLQARLTQRAPCAALGSVLEVSSSLLLFISKGGGCAKPRFGFYQTGPFGKTLYQSGRLVMHIDPLVSTQGHLEGSATNHRAMSETVCVCNYQSGLSLD